MNQRSKNVTRTSHLTITIIASFTPIKVRVGLFQSQLQRRYLNLSTYLSRGVHRDSPVKRPATRYPSPYTAQCKSIQIREMRIATLQIASRLGDLEGNIKRADELLKNTRVAGPTSESDLDDARSVRLEDAKLDILVLPELALTGYNFPSLDSIKPYLEEAGKGACAAWARETAKRLKCKVCIGYPEVEIQQQQDQNQHFIASDGQPQEQQQGTTEIEKYYNSLLVVNENGETLLNYRKTFLYYTDETWASEGSAELGFHQLTFPTQDQNTPSNSDSQARAQGEAAILPPLPPSAATTTANQEIATSFGICMDINPYRFTAPYSAYEFANRVLDSKSQLVILSMAWLTLLSKEELDALKGKPEMDTFNYWIQRFMPLLREKLRNTTNIDDTSGEGEGRQDKRIILVFANRAGEEPGSEAEPEKSARYAGTSSVIAITQKPVSPPSMSTSVSNNGNGGGALSDDEADGEPQSDIDVSIQCWGIMGAATEGVCFADTVAAPEMMFRLVRPRG
ncbi:carbon-nitrogen hydrolase [Aspergillus karnatakaensis]|uniref:putative protein N-terminal asparagine amidohydrolase n=1 Tax=Aspergillus karnatakaensis TaxID=1810916 RepID=UPI003CCD3AD6